MYNRNQIMESLIHYVKEFRLYSVVGKPLKILRVETYMFGVCDKKDDVGSVKEWLEEYKHRSRRPVPGHYNCSGCADFQFNGLIFVGKV